MGSLVLVPVPETTWFAANRVVGCSPVPLSEKGNQQASIWATALAKENCRVCTIYCGDEQAASQAAAKFAEVFGSRVKKISQLSEVSVGLFDGLSHDELKRRHPKIFKRWVDDPSSVTPPEGESLEDARDRLRPPLESIIGKLRNRCVALILGPLAFGVVRCMLESVELNQVRSLIQETPLRYPMVQDESAIAGTSAKAVSGGQ